MEVLGTESWLVAGAHSSFTRIVVNICSILVFASFLFALSWRIALVASSAPGSSRLVYAGSLPRRRKLGMEVKRVHQALGERMLISLQAMRTIRAFGQEAAHHERSSRLSAMARQTSLRLDRLTAVLSPATEIGYLVILAFIIGAAGWMQISFATALAAVALLYRLQPHVRELEGNLSVSCADRTAIAFRANDARHAATRNTCRIGPSPDKSHPPRDTLRECELHLSGGPRAGAARMSASRSRPA